ncbi:MAG: hypothetical protein JJU48_09945 [Methylophaga sp.]|nr:hypothetical protein [Methylophaga sp.]
MTVVNMPKADVILKNWNILQITVPGSGHTGEIFIGFSVNDGLGRLSTKIVSFDEEAKTGVTSSGSRYTCIGEPGVPDDEAIYVLEQQVGEEKVRSELFSEDRDGSLKFLYPLK